jgi:hypothetical protein
MWCAGDRQVIVGEPHQLQNVVERALILSETDTFVVDESWLKRESAESRKSREGVSALAAAKLGISSADA